jgi:hypothetical protein
MSIQQYLLLARALLVHGRGLWHAGKLASSHPSCNAGGHPTVPELSIRLLQIGYGNVTDTTVSVTSR